MMPAAIHKVSELRGALRAIEGLEAHPRIPLGHAGADACLGGGLLTGALHEVYAQEGHGAAGIGFTLALAARVADRKPVLWIRQDLCELEYGEVAGNGILEFGCDPRALLLLRVSDAKNGLRAAADALTCASLGAVVLELFGASRLLDLTQSRRLALACAHKGVTTILLRLETEPEASAAETRWIARGLSSAPHAEDWGRPRFAVELQRHRHGAAGHWTMEWKQDDRHFREFDAAHPGTVAEAASDRQDRAEAQARRATG